MKARIQANSYSIVKQKLDYYRKTLQQKHDLIRNNQDLLLRNPNNVPERSTTLYETILQYLQNNHFKTKKNMTQILNTFNNNSQKIETFLNNLQSFLNNKTNSQEIFHQYLNNLEHRSYYAQEIELIIISKAFNHYFDIALLILENKKQTIGLDDINSLIGINIDVENAKKLLNKMQLEIKHEKDNYLEILIPPYTA